MAEQTPDTARTTFKPPGKAKETKDGDTDGSALPEKIAVETAKAGVLDGFDVEKYRHHTARFAMDEDQERAFILQMRDLMLAFVDLGFTLSPVQHVGFDDSACGQNAETGTCGTIAISDVVKSIILAGDDLPSAFAAASKRQPPTER